MYAGLLIVGVYAGLLIVGVYAGLLIVGVCLIVNGGQKLIGYYLFLISLEGCTKRSVRICLRSEPKVKNRGRSPRCISLPNRLSGRQYLVLMCRSEKTKVYCSHSAEGEVMTVPARALVSL